MAKIFFPFLPTARAPRRIYIKNSFFIFFRGDISSYDPGRKAIKVPSSSDLIKIFYCLRKKDEHWNILKFAIRPQSDSFFFVAPPFHFSHQKSIFSFNLCVKMGTLQPLNSP